MRNEDELGAIGGGIYAVAETDRDETPSLNSHWVVYMTRGKGVENELVQWTELEKNRSELVLPVNGSDADGSKTKSR